MSPVGEQMRLLINFCEDAPLKFTTVSYNLESLLLFRAEYKPRGYYLEHFWQADLGYIGQAIIGVKVPNSSHVACIQHGRVLNILKHDSMMY